MEFQKGLSIVFAAISIPAFVLFLMLRFLDVMIAHKNHKDTNTVFKTLFYEITFMATAISIAFSLCAITK